MLFHAVVTQIGGSSYLRNPPLSRLVCFVVNVLRPRVFVAVACRGEQRRDIGNNEGEDEWEKERRGEGRDTERRMSARVLRAKGAR